MGRRGWVGIGEGGGVDDWSGEVYIWLECHSRNADYEPGTVRPLRYDYGAISWRRVIEEPGSGWQGRFLPSDPLSFNDAALRR